jgi:hypothetical protein
MPDVVSDVWAAVENVFRSQSMTVCMFGKRCSDANNRQEFAAAGNVERFARSGGGDGAQEGENADKRAF